METMRRWFINLFIITVVSILPTTLALAQDAPPKMQKVLVVMSYEVDNPWCIQVKKGIDDVLKEDFELKYFYLNTKKALDQAQERVAEALALYKSYQPVGVIAVDDHAQSMFVVPYLKDKAPVPVMFAGVNAEPGKYGYPASNISGVLERNFIKESVALAKQLVPTIERAGFLGRDSSSGKAIVNQIKKESGSYLAKFVDFKLVKTRAELEKALTEYSQTIDLLFTAATNGILDHDGTPMNNQQVVQLVASQFNKPTIGANDFHVKFGLLCAVTKSGAAQGKIAAQMLAQAMAGKSITELSVARNKFGKKMINVDVMQHLTITPKRRTLVGVELVRTTKE